jgi:chemotaxis protein CheD
MTQPHQTERRHGSEAPPSGYTVVKLFSGDCYFTDKPNHIFETILGSCVAACIRDIKRGIGGMNHFLLPEGGPVSDPMNAGKSTRYGAFAMENLINGILKLGGFRENLEIKVFGGGNVINNSTMIGDKNVWFVQNYLANEGFRIAGSDLGGDYPRRINYYPDTGRVMMRNLRREDDLKIAEEEKRYASSLQTAKVEGDIDLF